MDGETENEVKHDSRVSADSSNQGNSPVPVNGNGGEEFPAEMVASDQDEKNSESMKTTEEAPVDEEESGNELCVDDITTSEDLKMNEVNDLPTSREERVVFEINSMTMDDDGPPRLHLETAERQSSSPTQEEDEVEEEELYKDDINYEEYMRLHQQLCEDRDKAGRHHSALLMKLAEFFRKKTGDEAQPDRETPVSQQLQQYEKHINILSDLKQQLTADSESAQQQADEMRLKSQEKLDKAENEWQALLAMKQDVAVTVLSRRLGKQAAQAKVEATLSEEKLLQQELIKLHLKHIKLRTKVHWLEAELREGEEHARDPLHLQFEQLQAEKVELKKHTEKQNEESLKIQKKISRSLELLSNIKEKLFWSQMEVQAKQEQLAEVEAMVARRRDLLTRTRQARNSLQRGNLRLKEHRGLLGNRVLLRDFEDTVDASNHLEEQLEDLKCRRAEIVFSCGRRKKKLETS